MRINKTQTVFDATAATYDRDRMRLIPCHESFYDSALELIPDSVQHIVELGAGSGLFSVMLRQAFPRAVLHLIDFSGSMLDLAKRRFGDDLNMHYVLADYMTSALPRCDGIASSLSIHHLDDAQKQQLFVRAFNALEPGGVFVNADQILAPDPQQEEVAKAAWLAEVRKLGATEQQIADSLLRQAEDRCATVEDQLAWMRSAGFAEVRCTYARGRFAVMSGKRAG